MKFKGAVWTMFAAGAAFAAYLYNASQTGDYSGSGFSGFVQSIPSAIGGFMRKLNFAQLQALAQAAGFQDPDDATAAAIALAESSGNPNVTGDLNLTPGGSVGLWQINLKAHPEYTAAELIDPQTNANAAFAVYSAAGGFTPWSTFKSGAYAKYVQSVPAPAPAPAVDAAASTDPAPITVADMTDPGSDPSQGSGDDGSEYDNVTG